MEEQHVSDKQISRRTWISFAVFIVTGSFFAGAWKWLRKSPLETPGTSKGLPKTLRKVLNTNEKLTRQAFSHKNLVKTFPKSMAAKVVRVNGNIGIKTNPDPYWKLQVAKDTGDSLSITLEGIRKLPHTEIVFDFKCVEGWDQISHWGGVKFSDFIDHYGLHAQAQKGYVGFATPGNEYYIGIDMPSALHPQTLLCYEVNGQPLNRLHGAPLRLIIPVKYGIKSIKRIGSISFSDQRPPDYWAERGYDYYSGL